MPRDNRRYWRLKIARNKKHDRAVSKLLQIRGRRVIRTWGHSLLHPKSRRQSGQFRVERRLENVQQYFHRTMNGNDKTIAEFFAGIGLMLNQMSPKHTAQAQAMIRGDTIRYGTVFRRVRNGKSMAELWTTPHRRIRRMPNPR